MSSRGMSSNIASKTYAYSICFLQGFCNLPVIWMSLGVVLLLLSDFLSVFGQLNPRTVAAISLLESGIGSRTTNATKSLRAL